MSLSEEQRKEPLARIASVDGLGERGQFYITADLPLGGKLQIVVTASFLDKAGKKLSAESKSLFRIGAPILWKHAEGKLTEAKTGFKTARASKASYMDLTAVFTPAQEAEWQAEGLI